MSQTPFVIVDMFMLKSVEVDVEDQTAWVDSGSTIGELYYAIAEKSRVLGFPAGVCHSVGVGGHFSGGGYGNMMRRCFVCSEKEKKQVLLHVGRFC